MALLNICALTGGNMVVQVGLAFIRQEREVDYNWSLEFLRDIIVRESILLGAFVNCHRSKDCLN
jgi:hypothetical protein